jgi:anti-sigma-K factor RskA
MIDERREAQASLYVLGGLPPQEVREFEGAMRGDLELQLLVKELSGTAGAMVAAFPRVNPPPALKARILDAIKNRENTRNNIVPLESARDDSWMFWVPWALAACFALLCVLLISLGHSLREKTLALNQQLEERTDETLSLREQVAQMESRTSEQSTNYQTSIAEIKRQAVQRVEEINRQAAAITNQLLLQNAESRRQLAQARDQAERLGREKKMLEEALQATVGDKDRLANSRLAVLRPTADGAPGVVGASVWNATDQKGLIVVENLPALPPTQSYQFWLIDPKLGIPINGGVLPVGQGGSVRAQFAPQIRVDNAERFAISIEPAGGSPVPTKVVYASR